MIIALMRRIYKMNVYKMTVEELVRSGADVRVTYFDLPNQRLAQLLLDEFDQISDVKEDRMENVGWQEMCDGRVSITSFYNINDLGDASE